MKLSIVTCLYEMQREAPRTLLSMQSPYQKNVAPFDYEIIVIDNGAQHLSALHSAARREPAPIVLLQEQKLDSPVKLFNHAVRSIAKGDYVLIAIDGARIFSDHLVASTLAALERHPKSFVYTLSCHLGNDVQMVSRLKGYNQDAEDALIAAARWPMDPNALYSRSTLAGSSRAGVFGCVLESNAMAISRTDFLGLGGFDERFAAPGGGLSNLELFARLVQRPGALNICLASETTFHQIHGGAATSGVVPQHVFHSEYAELFSSPYRPPCFDFLIWNELRPSTLPFLVKSLDAISKNATRSE